MPHIFALTALFAQAVSQWLRNKTRRVATREETRGWEDGFWLYVRRFARECFALRPAKCAPQQHDSAPGGCVQHFVKYKVLLLSSARITALRASKTPRAAAAIIMMRMMPPG